MCSRCGGTGWISGYAHVEEGRCFKCNPLGIRYNEQKPSRLEHSATTPEKPCPYWRVFSGCDEESARLVRFFSDREYAWSYVQEQAKWPGNFIKVIAPEGVTLKNGQSTWSMVA